MLRHLAAAVLGTSVLLVPSVAAAAPPEPKVLSDETSVSHYGYPQTAAVARSEPSEDARPAGRLKFVTPDGQAQTYLALTSEVDADGNEWIQVRLPKRPNTVTGWVPAAALGDLHTVYGHLSVDRRTKRAKLFDRDGHTIWKAPVGVGRRGLATPAGHFSVTEKLRALGGPTYGPYAIGTSALAPHLSDWPGGGVIGLHGTDEPKLIPGRPSHGCIRLRNKDIKRLWPLIRVATPITIT